MKKRFKISSADIVYRLWWMLKKHECHERLENSFPPRTTHGKHSWSQDQHSWRSPTAQHQGGTSHRICHQMVPPGVLEHSDPHTNYLKMQHLLLRYIIGKWKHSVTLPTFFQPTFSAPMDLGISCIRFKKSSGEKVFGGEQLRGHII